MKRIVSVAYCLVSLCVCSMAQEENANPAPSTEGTNSLTAPATVTNSPASTEGKPPSETTLETKEKQDINELIKLPAFTNSSGIVMVKISEDFWAGKYEVTQQEYQEVMGANPSEFSNDRNPVDSVSWNDAMSFCGKLTQTERQEEMLPEGFAYSLPTQVQWESLAAVANLKSAVTSSGESRSGTATVGSLGPSGSGLYDVRGNVWEWCLDPQDKPFRVARGAAWDTSFEVNLRPDFRWYGPPDDRKNTVGFRCVLQPEK